MKRTLFTVLPLLILSTLPAAAGQDWKKGLAEAQKEARNGEKLILVEMYADWCGWCKKMAKELFPSKGFRDATADLVLLQLDTEDRKEGTKLARELRVTNLPTIFLLTPELAIAGVIQGYAPPERWVSQLENSLRSWEAFEKRVAEDTGGRTDPQSTFELAVELAQRRFWDDAEARFWGLIDNEEVPVSIRADAMLELSRVLLGLERGEESKALLDRLGRMENVDDETNAVALLMKAEMKVRDHDLQGALRDLQTVQREYPETAASANARQFMRIVEARLGPN